MSIRIVFPIAAAMIAAAPAAAQDVQTETSHARQILYRYANCLLDSDPKRIRGYLFGDPNDGAMKRWRTRLGGECLVAKNDRDRYYINPNEGMLRLALADAMLIRDPPGPPDDLDRASPLLQPREPAAKTKGDTALYQRWFAWVSRLGECVVRADPAGAHALLNTKPDSAEERAAFRVIGSSAGKCAGGEQLKIDPITFRGTIALNYLRLAEAASVQEPVE